MSMKQLVLKPQDVVILLKRITSSGRNMTMSSLAEALVISQSEVSESLERCRIAKLVDSTKRCVNTLALRDFLVSGLQYAFPAVLGPIVRGVPTYLSALPVSTIVSAGSERYVWPSTKGTSRGTSVTPLYPTVPESVMNDAELYELLVIADAFRLGHTRERQAAIHSLDRYLESYGN